MRRPMFVFFLAAGTIACGASPGWAQAASSESTSLPFGATILGGSMHANLVPGQTFWTATVATELNRSIIRGLSVAGDIAFQHTVNMSSSGVGLDLFTATFGPRYSVVLSQGRVQAFGQVLVGVASGINGRFPMNGVVENDARSLALETGGGIDIPISRRWGLRAIQADWLRTQFGNGANNVQNSLIVRSGITVHF